MVTDWWRDGVKDDDYEVVEGDFVVVDESIVIILLWYTRSILFFIIIVETFIILCLKIYYSFFIIEIFFSFSGLYLNKKLIQKYIR